MSHYDNSPVIVITYELPVKVNSKSLYQKHQGPFEDKTAHEKRYILCKKKKNELNKKNETRLNPKYIHMGQCDQFPLFCFLILVPVCSSFQYVTYSLLIRFRVLWPEGEHYQSSGFSVDRAHFLSTPWGWWGEMAECPRPAWELLVSHLFAPVEGLHGSLRVILA